ncbi:hypothetical protein [Psychrobacillus sp. FSL K6-1464]|uniref:hypothetical protein n=1 Tax=Psychrobacillus sp. FSL K6-1464 TaxID=2921545 RepID=UPI0030F512F2
MYIFVSIITFILGVYLVFKKSDKWQYEFIGYLFVGIACLLLLFGSLMGWMERVQIEKEEAAIQQELNYKEWAR